MRRKKATFMAGSLLHEKRRRWSTTKAAKNRLKAMSASIGLPSTSLVPPMPSHAVTGRDPLIKNQMRGIQRAGDMGPRTAMSLRKSHATKMKPANKARIGGMSELLAASGH